MIGFYSAPCRCSWVFWKYFVGMRKSLVTAIAWLGSSCLSHPSGASGDAHVWTETDFSWLSLASHVCVVFSAKGMHFIFPAGKFMLLSPRDLPLTTFFWIITVIISSVWVTLCTFQYHLETCTHVAIIPASEMAMGSVSDPQLYPETLMILLQLKFWKAVLYVSHFIGFVLIKPGSGYKQRSLTVRGRLPTLCHIRSKFRQCPGSPLNWVTTL